MAGDYVRHGTPLASFGGDRFSGGGGANTGLVPLEYVFLLVTFSDSIDQATAETAEPIWTLNGSNDASR